MSMHKLSPYQRASCILLGLETVHPEHDVISKVRFTMESLSAETIQRDKCVEDFFNLLKVTKDYPITPFLEKMVFTKTGPDLLQATLKVMDYLTYDPSFKNLQLLLGQLDSTVIDDEKFEKLLINFLMKKSEDEGFGFCTELVSVLLEKNPFIQIKKILEFCHDLYQDDQLRLLKKSYEHFVTIGSEAPFFAFLYQHLTLRIFNDIKVVLLGEQKNLLVDAFSKGQVKSKLWLVSELSKLNNSGLKNALVLCGWVGLLPHLLFKAGFQEIISVDFDESCQSIALRLNKLETDMGRFNAVTEDIFNLNYKQLRLLQSQHDSAQIMDCVDLLINTSCEHIEAFDEWYAKIPEGQLVVLQSNDFFDCDQHVNCVNSLADFREQTPMGERLFSGALPLENYTRFMVIGYK